MSALQRPAQTSIRTVSPPMYRQRVLSRTLTCTLFSDVTGAGDGTAGCVGRTGTWTHPSHEHTGQRVATAHDESRQAHERLSGS